MKALLCAIVVLFLAPVHAQVSLLSGDLPSRLGEWRRAYLDTSGIALGDLLGRAGGPQRWDFSYPRRQAEGLQRVEIVPASDGSCSEKSQGATFAERTTRESDGCASWEYFSLRDGVGRVYHGLCDPCSNPAMRGITFNEPTVELPECTYGSAWERTVQWDDVVDSGFGAVEVSVSFVARARVDAYGTLVLPNLGEVQALRVNETNVYTTLLKDFGLPLGDQYFHNVYWLVPGIGRAVHVVSQASGSEPPSLSDPPARVVRIFEASAQNPPPKASIEPVTNLVVQAVGGKVLLSWDSVAADVRYVVARQVRMDVPSACCPTILGYPSIGVSPGVAPPGLIAPNGVPTQWVPFLTNKPNFVLLDMAVPPSAHFFRVGFVR